MTGRVARGPAQAGKPGAFWIGAAIAAASLGTPPAIHAQNRISVAFAVTEPRGELARGIDTFNGPSVTWLRDVGSSRRWAWGLTAVGGEYGAADRPAPLPGFHARTGSSLVFVLAVLQLERATSAVQPYLQATAGYGSFTTATTVWCDDCTYALAETDHEEGTFVAGGSGGLRLRVYQRARAPAGTVEGPTASPAAEPLRIDLDFAVRYLRGGEAGYLPGDPVLTEQGTIRMDDRIEESLQVLQYQVGLSVAF
ncbi:MAG TPA: hypothetical protein VM778_12095 [Gemmatimonadota bacterium]|nr:hypothetical protein [Gemmatimonadota bacterium]